MAENRTQTTSLDQRLCNIRGWLNFYVVVVLYILGEKINVKWEIR